MDTPSRRSLLEDVPAQLATLCERLAALTGDLEPGASWPAEQQRLLAEQGVLGWVIPREYGGSELSASELLVGYHELSASCLTTAFILTQQNGASQRIAASDNDELKSRLLPPIARGETFATVGISHLTTSRQHWAKPAVAVAKQGGEWRLNGSVPWVTGAPHAEHVVTGGTLDDGRQLLLLVPTRTTGVHVEAPVQLMGLSASHTASITLTDVSVPEAYVLAGPVEGVMKRGAAGPGSLTTSALAAGHASQAIARHLAESIQRDDLLPLVQPLHDEWRHLWADLHDVSLREGKPSGGGPSAESLRQRANSLVLRATQSLLATTKGAGYLSGHPAERGVREAMFFLVWSCPQPVLAAALREFACLVDG